MHETILENRFGDHAQTVAEGHQRHDLRLQVRRKTRIGKGLDIHAFDAVPSRGPQHVPLRLDLHPGIPQLGDQRLVVARLAAEDADIPACHSGRDQEGSRFDPVRNHRRLDRMKRFHPFDRDHIASRPFDPRTHAGQHLGEVDDFRLACSVFQGCGPFRQRRGHQDVFRARHRGDVEIDVGPLQARRLRLDIPVPQRHLGPHLLERPDMEVDRPRPDRAAARQRDPGFPPPRHEGTQHQNRCPHGPDQIIGGLAVDDISGVDPDRLPALDLHPEAAQQFLDRLDVRQIRDVAKGTLSINEQG